MRHRVGLIGFAFAMAVVAPQASFAADTIFSSEPASSWTVTLGVEGRNALNVLDDLKVAVLDGTLDGSTLARLKVASEGLTEGSGDPGLDQVLGEIDLRVAVELAKAGMKSA